MRHDDGKPLANHGKPSSSDRLRSPASSCDCLRPPVGRLRPPAAAAGGGRVGPVQTGGLAKEKASESEKTGKLNLSDFGSRIQPYRGLVVE